MIGSRIAYLLSMIVASAVAALLIRRGQSNLQLSTVQKLGVALGGLIGATFAAKLPFILGADPNAGLVAAWMSDGKTVLWGLAGGYLGVELAKWSLHLQISTGDTFILPVALAIAIGRFGCLLYGCCYGIETNQAWGLRFIHAPDAGTLLRHPTQLYEIVFHLSFAALFVELTEISPDKSIHRSQKDAVMRGNWMPVYIIAYCVFRFLSEYWRPELRYWRGLTFYQWSCVAIALGFAGLILARWWKQPKAKSR